jgi:hypothetical protein
MLSGVIALWFLLTAGSLLFVVYDSLNNTPTSWVQRLAWILVVAYTGPVGLFVYMLACRSPGPGMHDQYTKALWKQGVNSEMHCLAGDATGILLAAAIVPAFGFANGVDLVIEYITAYLVGLFLFQAMMMVGMYQGDYLLAVRKTIFAETVSMNMVMLGMIPAMLLLNHLLEGADGPLEPKFWFVMSMATLAGGLTAYPVNFFLVKYRLKHGCMTIGEKGPDAHLGHRSPQAAMPMSDMHSTMHSGHAMPVEGGDEAHHHTPPKHDMDMPASHDMDMPASQNPTMAEGEHAGHAMGTLSASMTVLWIVASFIAMFAAAWATSLAAPIRFTS